MMGDITHLRGQADAKSVLEAVRSRLSARDATDRAYSHYERIAIIWSGVLGVEIEPSQVVLCLNGLALARAALDRDAPDAAVDGAQAWALLPDMVRIERALMEEGENDD